MRTYATNTKRAYNFALQAFGQWCEQRGAASFPSSPETVVAYLSEKRQRYSSRTLSLHIWAIKLLHEQANLESPTESPLVKACAFELRILDTKTSRTENPSTMLSEQKVDSSDLTVDKVATALGVTRETIWRRLRSIKHGLGQGELVHLGQGYTARRVSGQRWTYEFQSDGHELEQEQEQEQEQEPKPQSARRAEDQFRARYRAMLHALEKLESGSHYTAHALFGNYAPCDWAMRALHVLESSHAIEEIDDGYCIRDRKALRAASTTESSFCALIDWSESEHLAAVALLSRGGVSLFDQCQSYAAVHNRLGERAMRARFGMQPRNILGLRYGARLDRSVVDAVDAADLTNTVKMVLLYELRRVQSHDRLALVHAVADHGATNSEVKELCEAVENGSAPEAATAKLLRAAPLSEESEEPAPESEVAPSASAEDLANREVLAATLKCAAACVDLCVEVRNMLLAMKPKIDFLADGLGFNKPTNGKQE